MVAEGLWAGGLEGASRALVALMALARGVVVRAVEDLEVAVLEAEVMVEVGRVVMAMVETVAVEVVAVVPLLGWKGVIMVSAAGGMAVRGVDIPEAVGTAGVELVVAAREEAGEETVTKEAPTEEVALQAVCVEAVGGL